VAGFAARPTAAVALPFAAAFTAATSAFRHIITFFLFLFSQFDSM